MSSEIEHKVDPEDVYAKNAEDGQPEAAVAENVEEVPITFPQRLMELLSDETVSDVITWLPHGKGFEIRDKKRFGEEVLPRYFKRAKYTSFTRKLNRWNFVRVTRGPETGAYYHTYFQKDKPKLISQMTCINSKAPQQLQPMNPVALGLTNAGRFDGTEMQRSMQEQRQAFMQQQWQQQQAFMQWYQQQQENKEGKEGEENEEKNADSEQKQGEGTPQTQNMQAMMAFQQQQQQYYAMFMAHGYDVGAGSSFHEYERRWHG